MTFDFTGLKHNIPPQFDLVESLADKLCLRQHSNNVYYTITKSNDYFQLYRTKYGLTNSQDEFLLKSADLRVILKALGYIRN